MQEGASDQCILLAVGFVVAAELRCALLDAVEVFMQVQTLVLRFEHAAGNVGAVVCHTLEVCEQVRPDEAGFQTARAFLKPRDLARAQLVLQTVNDLLKRFDAACRGQVSGPEGGETQMDDFLHGVLERRQFLLPRRQGG